MSMRLIVATAGICLIGFAAGWHFLGLWTGAQIGIALLGIGMTMDAVRPNQQVEHHKE